MASQRGRIKQQLWPRRVVCDSISRGSRQQRQPWKTRPDKTRQARQDRTRVQASWQSHWSRPIGSARTRPPGPGAESGSWISTAAAPETLFLSLCYCVTHCHLSRQPVHLPPPSPSSPSRPPGHPRLCQTMESAVCCPRDYSTRASRCNGQQKKTLFDYLLASVRTWQQQRVRSRYNTVFTSCIMLHSPA